MNLPKETMEILEALVPELAESEDERIRKNLKDFLWRIANGEMNDRGTMPCAEKCQKWIAYLEKQKEPKPLPPFDEVSPEEKMNHPLYLEGFDTGREVQRVFDEPSWKPSEEQMKALNEIVNILAASPFLHQNDYLFNILKGLREELKKLL